MPGRVNRTALGLAVSLSLLASTAHGQFLDPDGDDLVRVAVHAERDALAPGGTHEVAVTLEIEPEWYIYWLNPGDAGAPTELAVTASVEGAGDAEAADGGALVRVGEPRWPGPSRYVRGGYVDLVYRGRPSIIFPVTLDERVPAGAEVRIEVQASWMVCKELCLLGEGVASRTFPVAAEPGPADDAEAALVAAARERTPRPLPDDVRVGWEGLRLVVEAPGAERLALHPLSPVLALPEHLADDGAADGERLAVRYPAAVRGDDAPVKGLVELVRGGRTTFHWIRLDAPPATDG